MPFAYRDLARVLLATIRLINGVIALLIPALIIKRFEADPAHHPGAAYALRMFGIRTVLIAIDLYRAPGPARDHAVRVAPLIHVSDTIAAILAARSKHVSGGTGALIVAISTLNIVLSLAMQKRET